jgi:hypothetical protein
VATPTLDLLAELDKPEWDKVFGDAGRGAAEPKLPWLADTDAATADALRGLFLDTAAGRVFASQRLGLDPKAPESNLAGVLLAFHEIAADDGKGAIFLSEFDNECRTFKAKHGQPDVNLKQVSTAVASLLTAFKRPKLP